MNAISPNHLIMASQEFVLGLTQPSGLKTILDFLHLADSRTQIIVLQNIRQGLEYSSLYRDAEVMKTLLRYLIPQVNQYTHHITSNIESIPQPINVARSLADDIVYLNRYANFRNLAMDQELKQLFDQTRIAVSNSHRALGFMVVERAQNVSLYQRISNQISSMKAVIRHSFFQTRRFVQNAGRSFSAGIASIGAGATYIGTLATTPFELGALVSTGAYGVAGALGIAIGAGVHFSGIGEHIGTDFIGEEIGDFVFDLIHR